MQTITTADGTQVTVGDAVYDYYNMQRGVVATEPDAQGWFYVKHDAGGRELLNGERICSLAHAARKGWS